MSERHADHLYQRLLEGGELTAADRLHLAGCEACRRAVAEVDRLDQRLEAAATTLVSESLPPGILDEPRAAPAARRWQLAIGVAAIAVIATLSIGPVANLLVADASPTPSASPTETALPSTTPSAQPSDTPEPLPAGLIAGPDLCGNGAGGFEISVPDGWYANAGGGLDPACTDLAPDPFDFTKSIDAPVQLVMVTGTFEDATAVVDRKETPAAESVVLAGYPALRLEYPAVAGAADQQRAYLVSAGDAALEEGGNGRYLVAMTTQGATYDQSAAALDEAVDSVFFFEPMLEDPAIAAAADALMADTDSCQSPDGAYTVSFPASWHTAEDGRCAAFATGPLPGPFGDYPDEMYPDAQITLGISEEAFGSIDPAISLDRFWLAGRPAMRLEWQGGVLSPGPTRSYSYVIGLGRSFDAGPNFIASTSNTGPGDYALNRAVVDRMMGTLSLGQAKADLVRLTDPDLANGGPSVVAFDGSTFVGGGLECVGALGSCRSMLYTSTDMIDWSRLDALPDPPDVVVDAIAVGDRGWVAFAGTSGWFSPDGTHWQAIDTSTLKDGLSDGGPAYQFEGPCCVATVEAVVATAHDAFVAVGGVECYKCAGRAAVWRSADGRSWSRLPYDSDFEGGPMTGLVELPNGRLVAVGAAAWTSDDGGQTWQRHDAAFAGAAAQAGVAVGSGGLVAAGGEFETIQGVLWTSADGETWRRLEPASLEGVAVTAVGWHDGRIVLAGEVQTDDTLVVDSVARDGTFTPLTLAPDRLGRISSFEEFDGRLLGLGTSIWVSP